MVRSAITKRRLLEIKQKIGLPPPKVLEYLKQLDKETQQDDSLREFLEWVQGPEGQNLHPLLPEQWLRTLCIVRFSDEVSVSNLRLWLASKMVNYLILQPGHSYDSFTCAVKSDPDALGPGGLGRRAISISEIHSHRPVNPSALVSISFRDNVGPNPHNIPSLVLPIGRYVETRPHLWDDLALIAVDSIIHDMRKEGKVFGPDSFENGTIPTPVQFIENSLRDLPQLIKYLRLSDAEMEDVVSHYEHEISVRNERYIEITKADPAQSQRQISLKMTYIEKLFSILNGTAEIPRLRRTKWETKRHELCRHITPAHQNVFFEGRWVVVVDAITPGHPIWAIECAEPKYFDYDPRRPGGTCKAVQIFRTAAEWRDSYGQINGVNIHELIRSVERSGAGYPLIYHPADPLMVRELFDKLKDDDGESGPNIGEDNAEGKVKAEDDHDEEDATPGADHAQEDVKAEGDHAEGDTKAGEERAKEDAEDEDDHDEEDATPGADHAKGDAKVGVDHVKREAEAEGDHAKEDTGA